MRLAVAREEACVQVGDARGALDQAQVPVGLEGSELRRPEGAEWRLRAVTIDRVPQDLGDRRVGLVRGAGLAPCPDAGREGLVDLQGAR
jgi:hypothetical protein